MNNVKRKKLEDNVNEENNNNENNDEVNENECPNLNPEAGDNDGNMAMLVMIPSF